MTGLTGLLLTGCGQPAGIDGALFDDWAPLAEPTVWAPPLGACHDTDLGKAVPLDQFGAVDCAAGHRAETVHVGTFAGAAAQRPAPPANDAPEIRAAFGECDGKAREYVGDEWRGGRLRLGVALPSAVAWTGGARWYRCDMAEVANVEFNGDVVSRTASVRGVLKSATPVRLACYSIERSGNLRLAAMPAVDCAKPHNGEFVGVWNAPEIAYPTRDVDWVRFYDECWKLVSVYVGAPDDVNLRYRSGILVLPASQPEWQAGNRGVRCYLRLSGEKTVTRSVKGVGLAGLPLPR
ncbi:septum formation family protein [Micromonospora pisi]|uniref:septum formation family protein n=1 Tax=Micromonospora pisi TaxID=589240 RepID=UPI001FE8495F|nr:septum formation family protein [Micromonospora pisi]